MREAPRWHHWRWAPLAMGTIDLELQFFGRVLPHPCASQVGYTRWCQHSRPGRASSRFTQTRSPEQSKRVHYRTHRERYAVRRSSTPPPACVAGLILRVANNVQRGPINVPVKTMVDENKPGSTDSTVVADRILSRLITQQRLGENQTKQNIEYEDTRAAVRPCVRPCVCVYLCVSWFVILSDRAC